MVNSANVLVVWRVIIVGEAASRRCEDRGRLSAGGQRLTLTSFAFGSPLRWLTRGQEVTWLR